MVIWADLGTLSSFFPSLLSIPPHYRRQKQENLRGEFSSNEKWSIYCHIMPFISGEESLLLFGPQALPCLITPTLLLSSSRLLKGRASGRSCTDRKQALLHRSFLTLTSPSRRTGLSGCNQLLQLHMGGCIWELNVLVGSEALQTKQKLWMRQNSAFAKEGVAVLLAQSLVESEKALLFSLQHDVAICFVQG